MATLDRDNALSLLATQSVREIIQEATQTSAALATFRTIRMSAKTASMPVLSALPTAGFVGEHGDSEDDDEPTRKPATRVEWGSKELVAREIAVIVPIHENLLADAEYDIWAEVRPLVAEEFGRVLDAAVLFGVNKPAAWQDDALVPGAIAAGNVHAAGTGTGTHPDLADDVNEAFGLVETDGFDVNVAYTGRFLRKGLRGLRDDAGQPIYLDNIRSDRASGSIYGQDLFFVTNGAWDRSEADLLVGDRNKAILGVREDVSIKLLDQATIQLSDDSLIHLAQDDMVALRAKMRVAFAVATPLTRDGGEDPYPFAVVTPAGSS
jgi:HK97 family phage major capsid protein